MSLAAAEIDQPARGEEGGVFGPRFTQGCSCRFNNRYALIGDVIVGGSQNLVACGLLEFSSSYVVGLSVLQTIYLS
jgi:hypothetical protein